MTNNKKKPAKINPSRYVKGDKRLLGNKTALGNTGGRPRIFETPNDLLAAFKTYAKTCKQNKEYIDKIGFCLDNDYNPCIISDYAHIPEFSNVIKYIDNICRLDLVKRGLNNEYNSTICKLVLASGYGMYDKQVIAGDAASPLNITITAKEAEV